MMNESPKFIAMRFLVLMPILFIFLGCPGSSPIVDDIDPITNTQFTFHQETEKLYFSAHISSQFDGENFSLAKVLWYGTDTTQIADSIMLNDDGLNGDILSFDDIYSIKTLNDSSSLNNYLRASDSGMVYYSFLAEWGTSTATYSDSSTLGNLMPSILSITFPDTMVRPNEQNLYHIDSIFVLTYDPNGLDDIQSCYLLFKKPDGSYANNGDPIMLYDDGIKYPEDTDNPSVWDLSLNDGIYSRLITIGSDNPLGTYEATFWVKDWDGLFSYQTEWLEVIE